MEQIPKIFPSFLSSSRTGGRDDGGHEVTRDSVVNPLKESSIDALLVSHGFRFRGGFSGGRRRGMRDDVMEDTVCFAMGSKEMRPSRIHAFFHFQ